MEKRREGKRRGGEGWRRITRMQMWMQLMATCDRHSSVSQSSPLLAVEHANLQELVFDQYRVEKQTDEKV